MKFKDEDLRKLYHRKVLNQELSLREFEEKKLVVQSRPSKAIIELTENCNYRCLMCAQAFYPKYQRYHADLNMPLELFDKVAAELFPDAYFIDLRGFGESVILPYWPDIVDRLDDYPLVNWHLVTNLSLPRDKTWEKMVKQCFMLGFSCDAATKEVFEAVRVRSHFDSVMKNLKLVTDCMKSENKGFMYFITTVQTKNIGELPGIIQLAHAHGVPQVQFKVVREFDVTLKHGEMIKDSQQAELRASIQKSLDLALDLGVRLTINDQELLVGADMAKVAKAMTIPHGMGKMNFPPPPELDPEFSKSHDWVKTAQAVLETTKIAVHQRCFKPFHYTYVSRDGRVGTCNHMMNPDMLEMGNLNYQSFADIWNGDEYQAFRRNKVYAMPMDLRCQWCFKHRLED